MKPARQTRSDSNERELKLAVPADEFDALVQASVAMFHPPQSPRRIRQRTTYFDTADLALSKVGVSVRLREADGERTQSIRAMQSANSGGVAVRGEWEWPLKSNVIDPRRLDVPPLHRVLPRIRAGHLKPIFRTEVDRTKMDVVSQGTLVEFVFDRGHVVADGNRQPISEVETELK